MSTAQALAQTGTPPPEARGLGRRDGRPPARDLRLRVLHQEPAPPGLRQPAEGPPHLRQGGGGQRPRRGRGGGHPPRRRGQDRGRAEQRVAAAARQPGDAVPRHGHRQRPRHRPAPDPADLRQAPLRLEVPPAPHEPGPAGNRDLRGRHVRPAHDREARPDHLAHQRPVPRPLLRGADRHQEERAADLREQEDRLGEPPRHPGDARDRGALPAGPVLGGRVPRADRHRQPARGARLPHARGADAGVPADDPRAAAPAPRDQAASLRDRVRHPPAHAPGHAEPRARRIPRRRLQPGLPRRRARDLPDGQAVAERAAAQHPRRGRRGALQGHPGDQDHGAAVELDLAHRREGDPPRPLQADQGRVLHRGDSAARGVPRQSLRDRGGARLRQGAGAGGGRPGSGCGAARRGRGAGGRRRARPRHPLREPRPAPLPAVGVRHLQGRARHRLAHLRRLPVPGRPPRRADGDLRPHGLGLGALHQRVQGSDRRLRRDPEGDQARAPGVRAPARRVPAAARAGQERVPPAEHLRALHRGGRRGLRPAQGREDPQGEAQEPAPEDRHEADGREPDRRDPGPRRGRPGGPAALDHRHARRARGGGAGPARTAAAAEAGEGAAESERPTTARRKGKVASLEPPAPARRTGKTSAARPVRVVAHAAPRAARREATKPPRRDATRTTPRDAVQPIKPRKR